MKANSKLTLVFFLTILLLSTRLPVVSAGNPGSDVETTTDSAVSKKWYQIVPRKPNAKEPTTFTARVDTLGSFAALKHSFLIVMSDLKPDSIRQNWTETDSLARLGIEADSASVGFWTKIKYGSRALKESPHPSGATVLSFIFPLVLCGLIIYGLIVLIKLYFFRKKIQ